MGNVDGEEAMKGSSSQEEERVLVSVRVRPLNEKEALRNEAIDWECINSTTITYKNNLSLERSLYPTSYTFDRVFKCDCSTRQVYEEGAKAVVLSVVSGINSSVFAYGQTSSGKTFTMSGITECTMEDIFDYIQKHKERDFHLKFSAMEIYNESVRDLLTADNSPLRLLDDPERGTVVEKLTEETLHGWSHFKELLAICEAQRQIGETFLNEASSRSHQILRLTIESSTREFLGKNNSSTLAATLNFVDLAGSERASQALSFGSRMKEGSHINRSLLTLGTVIRKLSKGQIGHIPYRDSKLTRILQSSLGGNARTAIICTMSPARSYVEQSRNTLLFASCAKEITTNACVNVVMSDKALVKHLQRELARLENELLNAGPPVTSGATDLLREKDFKIEELERRVKELILQLDLAQSQIHDLQKVGDESPVTWEEVSSYPKLHVRQASESSQSDRTTVMDHHTFNTHSPTFEIPGSQDRHSIHSYDENYSISDFDENLPPSSPFERMFIETPSDAPQSMLIQTPDVVGKDHHLFPNGFGEQTSLSGISPYVVSEASVEQTPNSFKNDLHHVSKEIGEEILDIHRQQVSNGQGAQSPYFVEFDPFQVSDEYGEQTPNSSEVHQYLVSERIAEKTPNCDNVDLHQTPKTARKQTEKHFEDYCKEVQCIESENMQGNSLLSKEERQSLLLVGHENDRSTDDEPKQDTELERNFQSNDVSISASFIEEAKYEMKNESEDGGEEFIVGLEDIPRKLSAPEYNADNGVPRISMGDRELDDTSATDMKVSDLIDNTDNYASLREKNEIIKAKSMDHLQLRGFQVEDTLQKTNYSIKNMKDVGFNPQDDLDASAPPSDVKRLQKEIFDLWDACHISLVHRTYFFLLFINGDQADTIYMEVERRRLSYIKDAFSWSNSIILDGRKLTPGSSRRSLHREREMLARLMKRRLSSHERIDLYVKWGISLDTKRRSSQLAHRLWVNTTDMDHITRSVNIVAKLVRFSEPQVPKEVFGLNLTTTQQRRRSFRWKQNSSLLT